MGLRSIIARSIEDGNSRRSRASPRLCSSAQVMPFLQYGSLEQVIETTKDVCFVKLRITPGGFRSINSTGSAVSIARSRKHQKQDTNAA